MTQYTHPDHEGLFPKRRGQFVTINDRQIGSAFFRTAAPEDIKALGFIEYIPPEPPAPEPDPIPQQVTRRQILTALGMLGWLTKGEAKSALTAGQIPSAVQTVINSLPEDQQFAAEMKWIGFQTAYRNDDMVLALAQIENKTEEDVDNLFILASQVE